MTENPPLWQALSLIHALDAASLVRAVLDSDLPGYRAYLPTSNEVVEYYGGVEEVVKRFYPEAIFAPDAKWLIDISQITRETGWVPTQQIKDQVEK